jgi:hypothetical protein
LLRHKPIIKDLNYTKKEIAEVKRIQVKEPITKRKEMIRNVLQGPMCCICAQIPKKIVQYNLGGVIRIESYCEICFPIYERNKDISLSDIAETYNCTIAPPGTFGGGKIEGYSLTPKSSISDHPIICRKCGIKRITFHDSQRRPNGGLIPIDFGTMEIHQCDLSYSFPCSKCDEQIYLDRKVLSPTGRRIPLDALDGSLTHV